MTLKKTSWPLQIVAENSRYAIVSLPRVLERLGLAYGCIGVRGLESHSHKDVVEGNQFLERPILIVLAPIHIRLLFRESAHR